MQFKSKFLRAALAAGTSLLLSVSPVMALATSTNSNTGADSTNATSISTVRSFSFSNTNTSSVVNNITSRTISGDNSASSNTGAGVVITGDASKTTTASTLTNATSTNMTSTTLDPIVTNSITGANSANSAAVAITNTTVATSANAAEVTNTVDSRVISGDNAADANTGGGSVDTGNSEDGTEVGTEANTNVTNIQGGIGDTEGTVANSNTGSTSTNTTSYTHTNTAILGNTNFGLLDNLLTLRSRSGNNTASSNTGPGSVGTGDSLSLATLANFLNNNEAVLGDTDPVSSSFNGGNDTTGAMSNNVASGMTANTLSVANSNNAGSNYGIDNTVDDRAISGDNGADSNTGAGDVDAGESTVDVFLSSTENWNSLSFAGFGANTDTFANMNTGFDSTNSTAVSHIDTATGGNINLGFLSNIFDNIARSGNNTSSSNTGGGSVETDDSEVIETTDDAQNVNVFGPVPTP